MHIKVKVVTNARKEKVIIDGDRFEIYVKEKPERNMANKRVLELIQAHFKAPARIVSGHRGPNKLIEV